MTETHKEKGRGIEKIVLGNGVTLLFDCSSVFRSAACNLMLQGGILDEPQDKVGVTHFLEHLLFKSSKQHSPKQIAGIIDKLGGDVNAFTEAEALYMQGVVPKNSLEELVKLIADLVLGAEFKENSIALEREVIRQEILSAEDDPEQVLMSCFYKHFYRGSAYANPILGTQKTINSLTADDFYRRLNSLLVGKRMIWTFAGNVDIDKCAKQIETICSAIPMGENAEYVKPKTYAGECAAEGDFEQNYFVLGQPWTDVSDTDYMVGNIFSVCFGESVSSRLFQNIREKLGLVYDIESTVESYRSSSAFLVLSTAEQKNIDTVIEKVLDEFKRLANDGFSGEELQYAKDLISAQIVMSDDLLESRLWRLSDSERIHNRYISVNEVWDKVQSVSLADLNAFVGKWVLNADRLLVRL